MKKLILLLWTLCLVNFTGCSGIEGMIAYEVDKTLQNIKVTHILPTKNTIGFEWEEIKNYRIGGINIYKKTQNGEYLRIGIIGNPYATHFVDTNLKPSTFYSYKFSTFALGKESLASKAFRVKTLKTFNPISFIKSYPVGENSIKILWRPHDHPAIKGYVIERAIRSEKWEYLATVKGRLMSEYIDTLVRKGRMYNYRVIAQSYDGIKSLSSPTVQLAF